MKVRFLRLSRVRISALFLFIAFFLYQNSIYADANRLDNTHLAQEITLIEAIHHISEQYQVLFNYDRKIVSDIKVQYEPEQFENVDAAIASILKETNLKYQIFSQRYVVIYKNDEEGIESLKEMIQHFQKIVDNREDIVLERQRLRPSPKLIRTLPQDVLGDRTIAFSIEGTVTDQDGEPLIGVNIQVKGTNMGTSTDIDGQFTLDDIDENAVLVVSYIGYQTQEVPVSGKSNLSVVLLSDSQLLDEVVVVGYGTQKKVNLTGAVSSVGADVLASRPLTTIGEGLQGTISNLNITPNSGAPGQGTSFNIRGTTSLSGGSPLVLVNGVSMDINMLNPQDVESVTVLKDGASSAIYGARAAFGVILITTKGGKKSSKPQISISSNVSSNSPVTVVEWWDSKELMEWQDEAWIRASGKPYYDDIQRNAILSHYNDPSQPSSIIHPRNPNEFYNVGNTNWKDVLTEDSYPMQQHTLNLTGGTENLMYYTSFSYLNQRGLIKKDLFDENYKRYNFLADLNYQINDWISVGTRMSANMSNKRFPPNDSWFRNTFVENQLPYQINAYPTIPVKDPNGNYSHYGSVGNLVQMLSEGGHQARNISDLWLTGDLRLTPIKGMSINLDYTYNPLEQRDIHYVSLQPFYDVRGDVNGYYGGSNPNRVIRENKSNQYHAINIYADYETNLNEDHNFKILVGYNQESRNLLSLYAERRNLIVNEIPYIDLASGQRYANDGEDEYAIRGVFNRLNYNYKNKYLFEINGRYDGTSKFPKEDRFAFFPSGSVAWRIDQEEFFQNVTGIFDLLKVRASYGSLGNQNVQGYYPYIGTLGVSEANYLINGEKPVQITVPGLVSPTLTWETVVQKNLGLDVTFLNYRLSGSFDIYRRDTKDMLTKGVTLPAVLGVNEPHENAADLKTTGWDMDIGWKDAFGQFNYGVSVTLSDYKAVITKYDNPRGLISDHYVGKELGEIWGLVTGGIFQSDEDASTYNGNKISARPRLAGDLWHVDLNGDGEISNGSSTLDDPGDRKVIGNSTPRYSFGLRSFAEWKGFDFTLFFQGVGKRDLWLNTRYYLSTYTGELTPSPKIMLDYWSPENKDAYYPRPVRVNSQDITAPQTHFLQGAAYIRLKQLTFGYTIPKEITQRVNVGQVRVNFSGSNLWTGTKIVKIADPELAGPISYPLYKSYTLGVNVQF